MNDSIPAAKPRKLMDPRSMVRAMSVRIGTVTEPENALAMVRTETLGEFRYESPLRSPHRATRIATPVACRVPCHPQEHRSGVTLLLVIVCLIFVTAVMGTMLRQFHLSHRHQRQLERKQQANALAESAIERANFALQHDASYEGEVWSIDADELGSNHRALVTIQIHKLQQQTEISVEAVYPSDVALRARVRKQVKADF